MNWGEWHTIEQEAKQLLWDRHNETDKTFHPWHSSVVVQDKCLESWDRYDFEQYWRFGEVNEEEKLISHTSEMKGINRDILWSYILNLL